MRNATDHATRGMRMRLRAAVCLALAAMLAMAVPAAHAAFAFSSVQTAAYGVGGSCLAALTFDVYTGYAGGGITFTCTKGTLLTVSYVGSLIEGEKDSRLSYKGDAFNTYAIEYTRLDKQESPKSGTIHWDPNWTSTLELSAGAKYRIVVTPNVKLDRGQWYVENSFWEVSDCWGIEQCEMLESVPMDFVTSGRRKYDDPERHYSTGSTEDEEAESGELFVSMYPSEIEKKANGGWMMMVDVWDSSTATLTDAEVKALSIDDWIDETQIHFIKEEEDWGLSINNDELVFEYGYDGLWYLESSAADGEMLNTYTRGFDVAADCEFCILRWDEDAQDLVPIYHTNPYDMFGEDIFMINAYITLQDGVVTQITSEDYYN